MRNVTGYGDRAVAEHALALMLAAARDLAAIKADDADPVERAKAVSAAKVQVGEAGRLIGQEAVQIHGGIAMTDEYYVGHYFKHLSMIDRQFGDTDHHLKRFGGLERLPGCTVPENGLPVRPDGVVSKNALDEILFRPGDQPGRVRRHGLALPGSIVGAFLGLPTLGTVIADQPGKLIGLLDDPRVLNPKAVFQSQRQDVRLPLLGKLPQAATVDRVKA